MADVGSSTVGTPQPALPTPTAWQAGQSNDPLWEEILAAFNEEHMAKYGIPMNRPWGADVDAQRSYQALLKQYNDKRGGGDPTAQEPGNNYLVGGTGAGSGVGMPGYDDPTIVGGAGDGGGGGGPWSSYEGNVNSLLAGFKNPLAQETYALAKSQIQYAQRRLAQIEEARNLGDMTGTLTSDEKKMFQEMEDSAVANLKSQVNAQTQDVWNTALADLVNRGVLQGTVGQKILGTISSENVRTIGEGVNAIRGQTNANMLNVMEGNKNRALTRDQMLMQETLGLLGIGQGYANADLQAELQKLGLGVNANLGFAGMANQTNIAGMNIAAQQGLTQQQLANQLAIAQGGWQNQLNIAGLNAATQLQMGNLYSGAAKTASQYGLGGNVLALGAGLMKSYWDSNKSSGNKTSGWDDFKNWFVTNYGSNTSNSSEPWSMYYEEEW